MKILIPLNLQRTCLTEVKIVTSRAIKVKISTLTTLKLYIKRAVLRTLNMG